MSEKEIADVRAIALIRLAREFQHAYKHWMWAWAKLKSHRKMKALLKEFETHCQCRGWRLSDDIKKEIRREIEVLDYHIKDDLQEMCIHYANLRKLEREFASVLDEPWEWRDFASGDAVKESEWSCSEQE